MPRDFKNFNKEKIAQRHSSKPKKMELQSAICSEFKPSRPVNFRKLY